MIEKVHGLQCTAMSLNERFTMLASAEPKIVAQRPRRRPPGQYLKQNRNLIEQIARRLELQAKRFATQQALRQRMGLPASQRRFGSEGSLFGLRRANSFGSLHQAQSIKKRVTWRQSNGNLNRSASFSNLSCGMRSGRPLRGFRRRGGGQRALRGRFRSGGGRGGGAGTGAGAAAAAGAGGSQAAPARPQVARRGTPNWGRGRGGILRNQTQNPVTTKEELDAQLDRYMAGTKAALDKELETYMKNAMDLE